MFSVGKGVAFNSTESNRGTEWRDLRVSKLPKATVDRLRPITKADLERTLGVLAEYEIRDGRLVTVAKTDNFSKGRGVRRKDNRIQFGLTGLEISCVGSRLKDLLRQANGGAIKTF